MKKDSEFRSVVRASLQQTVFVAIAVALMVLVDVALAVYAGKNIDQVMALRSWAITMPLVLTFAFMSAAMHGTESDISHGRTRRSLATAGYGTFAAMCLFALLEAVTRGTVLGLALRANALVSGFVGCGLVFAALEVHWRRKAGSRAPAAQEAQPA